jgi:RNA polymerase sigma-70 factor (ECF subfamily)
MLGLTTTDEARALSDEEVLARSASEPWLFAVLLERYQEAFLRRARHIIRSEQDAEDIVQETFTKIYVHAAKYQPQAGAKFSSWAYMILTNTALSRYAKNVRSGKMNATLDPELEGMLADLSESTEDRENRDMIERILNELPGHFADVLRLFYLERWSHKDIAKKTGESVAAVKTRVHRAKQAFRAELKSRGLL